MAKSEEMCELQARRGVRSAPLTCAALIASHPPDPSAHTCSETSGQKLSARPPEHLQVGDVQEEPTSQLSSLPLVLRLPSLSKLLL